MSNEYLKKLAAELKSAREKKKITIEEIFTKTRIDKKFLAAIEQGNFSVMPEVYIRAFIKEYSKTIGLNPDEVLEKFKLAGDGRDFETSTEKVSDKKSPPKEDVTIAKIDQSEKVELSNETRENENKKSKTSIYILSALGMLITILLVYNLFLDNSSNVIVTEKPFEEIIESETSGDNSEAVEVVKSKNSDPVEKIESPKLEPIKTETKAEAIKKETQPLMGNVGTDKKLVLTIVGNNKSWIRVLSDENNNTEFILDSGMTKILSAEERFYLHIGNSGDIKLLLNDRDLNFTGSPGKVRKIFVTQNGIEYLRRTPVTINAD